MRNRAFRRGQAERLKTTRKHYWHTTKEGLCRRMLGIVSRTPAACSCWMCGNPRKYFKEVTFQEKKARLD